jgi:hypothetical protein
MAGWIGVDMDGTLAKHSGGSVHGIGDPVPAMVRRVRHWISAGIDVRIVTARVSVADPDEVKRQRLLIMAWCIKHLGRSLPVQNWKDYAMVELWDDRAVQVIPNTGKRADGEPG